MRVVLTGGVQSSSVALERLHDHGLEVVGVLAHQPKNPGRVSGFADLTKTCASLNIRDCHTFDRINAPTVLAQIDAWSPDVLFVVGLSQIVGADIRALPRLGSVGFHPTELPVGRGRAALAWLILQGGPGAATFFELTEGADEGGILEQEPYEVSPTDHVDEVYDKMLVAMRVALDRWLPRLAAGEWSPVAQDHKRATTWGKRDPCDGWLDWSADATTLDRLIRASSPPHPGAYCYASGRRLRVLRSGGVVDTAHSGVAGRVLAIDDDGYLIQCSSGCLRVESFVDDQGNDAALRVGDALNYRLQDEVHALRMQVRQLEQVVSNLTSEE